MISKNQIGAQSYTSDALVTPRAGRQGDSITSNLHGFYYEQVARGKVFGAANQAAVTTTAALATTFTGLAVANPSTSGVNLVLLRYSVAQFAVGAAAAIGLMTFAGAAAGSLVVRNRLTGTTLTSATTASAGATIATPVLEAVYGNVGSLATTGYGLTPGIVVQLDGEIVIPPGFGVASFTSIATTTALLFGLVWEEVPVL